MQIVIFVYQRSFKVPLGILARFVHEFSWVKRETDKIYR